jgi:hypothetical protein
VTASLIVAEATRRSAVVWVALDDGHVGDTTRRPQVVWHLWHAGSAWVLTGGEEQPLPGAATARRAVVVVRSKDKQGGRVVEWVADVARVAPGSPEWEETVPLLHARRLNARDGEQQPTRWARENLLLRLTPTGEQLDPLRQDA